MKVMELNNESQRLTQLIPSLQGCRTPFDAIKQFYAYLKEAYPGVAHAAISTRGLPPGSYRVCALIGDDGTEILQFSDLWKNVDLPIFHGGVLGEITSRRSPQLVRDLDWSEDTRPDPAFSNFRELIAVPLPDDRLPINWYVRLSREPGRFTASTLEQSTARAALVAPLLNSLQLAEDLARARRFIDAEVDRMAQIQRALLPDPRPQIPGVDVDVLYKTFARVGGDFYDFFPLGGEDDPWCIAIGDASGHGPSAAVVAAIVQAVFHDCAKRSSGPADLLEQLNRKLCRTRIDGSFVTAFVAFFDPRTLSLTFASAGHPEPMLGDDMGNVSRLAGAQNPPLGIDASIEFCQAETTLRPGQTLALYTDGISEASDPAGNQFGERGIKNVLREACGARSVVQQLESEISTHQRHQRARDDQTVLAIHVRSDADEPTFPGPSWEPHGFGSSCYAI